MPRPTTGQPGVSPPAIDRAVKLIASGRPREAAAAAQTVLDQSAFDPVALGLLGLAAHQQGESERGLLLLRQAMLRSIGDARLHHAAAVVLRDLGRPAEADREQAQSARLWQRRDELSHLPPRLRDYQLAVDALGASHYMDFPVQVHIETAALCSAACVFCPYPTMERKGQKMDDSLIDKILGDLEAIPSWLPFTISPFKISDPFMEVRLFDILADIGRRLPNAVVELFTNGAALTERKLDLLARADNVATLAVSVNDHRPDRYEAVMKLPWARTEARLEMLHRRRVAGELPFPVMLSRVGDGTDSDRAFAAWARARWPAFALSINPQDNWLAQMDLPVVNPVPPVGCIRWFELNITATGEVAFCCKDGSARHPIGNVAERSALEIYNDAGFRRYRTALSTRAGALPCSGCPALL